MCDIKTLHLESTDVCQAECPVCAHETILCIDTGGTVDSGSNFSNHCQREFQL